MLGPRNMRPEVDIPNVTQWRSRTSFLTHLNAGKASPHSIAERMVPELIRFLAVSLQVM